MNLKTTIGKVFIYRKFYRNYLNILLTLYIKGKTNNSSVNVKCKLRDGVKLEVPSWWVTTYTRLKLVKNTNISELKLTVNGISFKFKGIPIIIDPSRFSDLDAVFFYEDYRFLNTKERDVIDIGMNIGDSSIYFSINGANRVIGLEPFPYAFSFAEKNVTLNRLNNIILLNAGYGKDSITTIDQKISSSESRLISTTEGKNIPIFSLKTLINKYNIYSGILKIDCEGCEYALLEEDDDVF